MLNNFFRRLSLHIKDGSKTNIRFSVPFISILEPMNDVVDLLTLISVLFPFVKVTTDNGKKHSIKSAIIMIKTGELVFANLIRYEPFDLIDVTTKETIVKIGIK